MGLDSPKRSDGDLLRKKTLKKESVLNMDVEKKQLMEQSIDDSSNIYDDSRLPLNDVEKSMLKKGDHLESQRSSKNVEEIYENENQKDNEEEDEDHLDKDKDPQLKKVQDMILKKQSSTR